MSRISLHSFSSHCCDFVGGPLGRFPLLLLPQDPSASSTFWREVELHPLCPPITGVLMSGCLANPTPHSGYEPNFHSYMNEEHTQINLPDSHRSFPRAADDATIISTTEDPEGFPHSGAPQQQQANRSKQGFHNVWILR